MSKHIENSSYREKLIEHLFVGELLKISWRQDDCNLEVAIPEVDNSGYDVVAEANGVIRHIQIKASHLKSKTPIQKIHLNLAEKPSGCVLWVWFDEKTLELSYFLFFGGDPGKSLPSIHNHKVAKHTKGDSTGRKAERINHRVINKGDFKRYETIESIYKKLFGCKK